MKVFAPKEVRSLILLLALLLLPTLVCAGTMNLSSQRNMSIGVPLFIDNTNSRVGIGDITPASGLVVGSDTGAGYATGAGELYVQNDIEADGNIYMGNSLVATQSWITAQGYMTDELDPEVGSTTSTYVCYGTGSAVTCADSGITFTTATNALSVSGTITGGDFSCSDCLGDAEITGLTSTSVSSAADLSCTNCIGATEVDETGFTGTASSFNIGGNAGTATALAANPANCGAGQYPLGVAANGAVESCTAAASVGSVTNTYLCYGASSAVTCNDADLTVDNTNNKITVGGLQMGATGATITNGIGWSGTNVALRSGSGAVTFEPTTSTLLRVGTTTIVTASSTGLAVGSGYNFYVDTNVLYVNGASTNRVGINTASPDVELDIGGNLELTLTAAISSTGVCYAAGGGNGGASKLGACSSSIRYKEDVTNLTDGLDTIQELRPVQFTWYDRDESDIGFIAEEMRNVESLLVTYNGNGTPEGVKYEQVTAVLAKAVQEQQGQIIALESENAYLESELVLLEQAKTSAAQNSRRNPEARS